jgi:hypothetical protein
MQFVSMFSKIFKFIFGKRENANRALPISSEPSFDVREPFEGERFSLADYPSDWDWRRQEVLERDGGHCQVTGCINCRCWGDLQLHVHHKEAVILAARRA